MFLRGLARYIAELDDGIEVRRYVWPKGADRSKPLRLTMERTAFRGFALFGLILVIFGPLPTIFRGPVMVGFLGENKILQYAVWFLAGLLIWHAIVVLLRLIMLKVRLIDET
jgi:hypothetical protein